MAEYRVAWTIEISADSPANAAKEALEIMHDPFHEATAFQVTKLGQVTELGTYEVTNVDLTDGDYEVGDPLDKYITGV